MTHPNRTFCWTDAPAMRRFVATRGFAHLFVAEDGAPTVAHVPVTVTEAGTLRFHLARANRIVPRLDGAIALASIAGDDFYVSPDWYGSADQVPTWNYRAVEVEGRIARLDDAALTAQIDALGDRFERDLMPKPVWTRAKMTPGRFEAMLEAILGFELTPSAWRGTIKLGQNKPAADRAALAGALRARGHAAEALLVETA